MENLDSVYANIALADEGKTVCPHGNYNGPNSQGCCECGAHWYRQEYKSVEKGWWLFKYKEPVLTDFYLCIRCNKVQRDL